MANFGKTIDSSVIQQGLRELNPEIHFDMGTKLGMEHPYQAVRQGVFYHGDHICSMDRGLVPEYKQWKCSEQWAPCDLSEWDKEDSVKLAWEVVPSDTPGYVDLAMEVLKGKLESYSIRDDGQIIRLRTLKRQIVLGQLVWVGWRHTFEKVIQANIPGVTRSALAEKFSVDMMKYPLGASGTPEEMLEALHEE
jgi:hypothetical protein